MRSMSGPACMTRRSEAAASLELSTVTAGGVRLECRWWGPWDRPGPTLVLLHRGLGCVAMWRDFPDGFTGVPGFACSPGRAPATAARTPAVLPRRADYMHVEGREVAGAVLDAAGIDEAVLVGHSDGASVAIVHAGTHADDPARRVRALVLLAPHVFCEDVSIESIRAAGRAYRPRRAARAARPLPRRAGGRRVLRVARRLAPARVPAVVDRAVPVRHHRAGAAAPGRTRRLRHGGAARRDSNAASPAR